MTDPTTRSTRARRRTAIAAAFLLTTTVAQVALVRSATAATAPKPAAVPGLTVTTALDTSFGTVLTVTVGTQHTVRLSCASSGGPIVINTTNTTVPCATTNALVINGSAVADTVVVDTLSFRGQLITGTTVDVHLGAGNDVASVRHGMGIVAVYGGDGNDRIDSGVYQSRLLHLNEGRDVLQGEGGNDTLTNDGYLDPNPPITNPDDTEPAQAMEAALVGGAGADTLVPDGLRWNELSFDPADTLPAIDETGSTLELNLADGYGAPEWELVTGIGDPVAVDNTLHLDADHHADVRCKALTPGQPAQSLVIDDVPLPLRCTGRGLTILGTPSADAVTYDQTYGGNSRYGVSLTVDLFAGNDTATIRHPFGSVTVDGGAGNDRISIGVHNQVRSADGGSFEDVLGGAGNDVLTNLGYLDPNPPTYDPKTGLASADVLAQFDGGPGVDAFTGSKTEPEWLTAETVDSFDLQGGPGALILQATSGADTVLVHDNGNYGTIVTVTTAGKAKTWNLPTLLGTFQLQALGGNDAITVEHKSRYTQVLVDPGAGTDTVLLRPRNPYTYDAVNGIVSQPGWKPIAYTKATTEKVTVKAY